MIPTSADKYCILYLNVGIYCMSTSVLAGTAWATFLVSSLLNYYCTLFHYFFFLQSLIISTDYIVHIYLNSLNAVMTLKLHAELASYHGV